MNDHDTTPVLITVRRPRNSTEFIVTAENRLLVARFKNGLMKEVTFNTALPILTIEEEKKPTLITRGALVGTKLQFGDKKQFVMPSEVVVTATIHYDPKERCFFNSNTRHKVDSADCALLHDGLIIAGWINRI